MTVTTLTGRLDDLTRNAAVRVALATDAAGAALADRLVARQCALRDDGERGAQAAEYAMLGGVAAAGCGTMIVVLQSQKESLGNQIGRWLGRIFDFAGGFLG